MRWHMLQTEVSSAQSWKHQRWTLPVGSQIYTSSKFQTTGLASNKINAPTEPTAMMRLAAARSCMSPQRHSFIRLCSLLLSSQHFFLITQEGGHITEQLHGFQKRQMLSDTVMDLYDCCWWQLPVSRPTSSIIHSSTADFALLPSLLLPTWPTNFDNQGVSVNTTSAPSATCLCRLPQLPARNRPSMYLFFAQKRYGLLSFWTLSWLRARML